jgi:hypothetical protein
MIRRHQKRGPSISQGEKLTLISLVQPVCRFGHAQKARLEQPVLIFKPEMLLRWLQELVKKKWMFANTQKCRVDPSRLQIDFPVVVQLFSLSISEAKHAYLPSAHSVYPNVAGYTRR